MLALLYGTFWFLTALVIHLVLWRVKLPQRQLASLLLIFTVCFALAAVVGVGARQPLVCWGYFALFYWACSLCYTITYSAMEGDSPTLSLTRLLHRRGEEGVSHEEFEEFFRRRPFVGARIKALITDNIFIEEQGGYRLSPGRYLFFSIILGYRRIVFGQIKSGG